MNKSSRRALLAFASLTWVLGAAPVHAQADYPNRPVRIVIPYAPGGGSDAAARLLAAHLTKVLGQSFIVESRPGGNTTIAGMAVAQAPADGYTLLMTGGSSMSVLGLMTEKLPYDPSADFAPLGMLSKFPFLIAAAPSLGANTLQQAMDAARARPGQVAYASNGVGGMPQLGMEQLAYSAKVQFNHVPYKGFAPAMPDVITGRTPLIMADWAPLAPHAKSGAIKLLAVTSAKRSPLMPDVPTVAEQGFPGYEMEIWFGMYAPAKTPSQITARLGDEMRKWLSTAEARDAFAALGHEPAPSTPDEVRARVAAERRAFAGVIKAANIKAE